MGPGSRYDESAVRLEIVGKSIRTLIPHDRQAEEDEVLATLPHELRTPLNAILGYANMIKSGAVAEENKDRAIDTIERNARTLTRLVEDVLDVAADAKGVQFEMDIDPEIGYCKQLVEMHGGTIAADSPGEGRGATFHVCLPAYRR